MSNVPKLRFPEFEGEWEEKSLGEVVYLDLKPINKPTEAYLRLRVRSHGKGTFYETVDNPETVEMETLYEVKDNQLLVNITFAWEHAICVTNPEDAGKIVSHRFPTYSFTEGNDPLFYRYSILLPRFKYLLVVASPGGAGRNRVLNKTAFLELLVPVPTLAEQAKIANFLTLIDKRIAKQDKKVSALEQYKKGLMQKIFSREIRFKDDNGKDYPEWEKLKIGDIYEERSERGFLDLDLISVTISEGIKKRSHIDKKDSSSEDKSNYKLVEVNDLAYNSMRMWQGASGISPYRGITSPAYTILKSTTTLCHSFFGYLFKTHKMINIFRMHSQGLTSDTWNLKYPQLSKIVLTIPSLPEQTKIANFLSLYDRKIEKEKAKLEALREQKKGLLQQMFV